MGMIFYPQHTDRRVKPDNALDRTRTEPRASPRPDDASSGRDAVSRSVVQYRDFFFFFCGM